MSRESSDPLPFIQVDVHRAAEAAPVGRWVMAGNPFDGYPPTWVGCVFLVVVLAAVLGLGVLIGRCS